MLTELGLHWCDTAGVSRRSTALRVAGRHLLLELFRSHGAARREVLSVSFSAVVEEPSPQVKSSYCSLLEAMLVGHRALMGEHATVLHAWMSSIQLLAFPLQKRILDAVLHVAAADGSLTGHISMTMRKMMMQKSTDSRLVALHGLCEVVRTGLASGAATHVADAVSSLKFAFDMDHTVRKQLYVKLADLFRALTGSHSHDAHIKYLQQRVCTQLLRYVAATEDSGAQAECQRHTVSVAWGSCFDCIGQHAYIKEPLAELVQCVLHLLSDDGGQHSGERALGSEVNFGVLNRTIVSMVHQTSSAAVLHGWDEGGIISNEQKLGVLLPLQEVLLEWFPTIGAAFQSRLRPDAQEQCLSKTHRFWLTESYAMLSTLRDIIAQAPKAASCTTLPLVTTKSACGMLEPYLQYLRGSESFVDAFGLPPAPSAADNSDDPDEQHDRDDAEEEPVRRGAGRVLRQRRRKSAAPWWVGARPEATQRQAPSRRSRDTHEVEQPHEGNSEQCAHVNVKVEKAFPCGLHICTELIRRRLSDVLSSTVDGAAMSKDTSDTVSVAFAQLVRIYVHTNSMRWEDAADHSADDSGLHSNGFSGRDCRERRQYSSLVQDKLFEAIKTAAPSSKRSRLQLHSQQEMCFYKCRVACLEALTSVVSSHASRTPRVAGDLRDLFVCAPLIEAYGSQAALPTATEPAGSASLCAVYFSTQLRDEVAAGITPPLLIAYVRWIQCLLHCDDAGVAANTRDRQQVAANFQAILSKFEIDAPGIVKMLLQSVLDLCNPSDARTLAVRVLRTLSRSPRARSSTSVETPSGGGGELLLCATAPCQHAAVKVAVRFLTTVVKTTAPEAGAMLDDFVGVLSVLIGQPSAAAHLPLRPVLAGLVQSTIGQTADVCRSLHDSWPTRRGLTQRSGGLRIDTIDLWPALYGVLERCTLKLLPAVRGCTWLTGGAQDSSAVEPDGSHQWNHVPRLLQAIEDLDSELMHLCQLATRDGASAYDAVAGGIARPILKSLKAIQGAVTTAARANTAAAAQEAQQRLRGTAHRPRIQPAGVKRKRKRRHAIRSRNSYVDAVLHEEEDGGDSYADLEDWIVFKRGRQYTDA